MALLSTLQDLQSQLNALDKNKMQVETDKFYQELHTIWRSNKILPSDAIEQLHSQIKNLNAATNAAFNAFQTSLDKQIQDHMIQYNLQNEAWVKEIDRKSWEQWSEFIENTYGNSINQFNLFVGTRIKKYVNWQIAATFFHPDQVQRIEDFFGFYPIYTVEKYREAAAAAKTQSHSQNRKIRSYDTDHLTYFPKNAIGLTIVRNYFTHCSISTIEKELKWIDQTSIPGAVIGFNFNDCSRRDCIQMFEKQQRSFVLKEDIENLINELGYSVIHWEYLDQLHTTWVEIKKSGEFNSIKRGETLGYIITK